MATQKILTHIDLNGNEIQNGVLQNLASDPSSGKEGQKYFNTTTHKERIYSNGEWKNAADDYALPAATTQIRGGVKVGDHLNVTNTDVLNVDEASTSQKGVIEIATDTEAAAGEANNLAITPVQLITVKKALENKIKALPTPMQFKGSLGTGGTITSLPTASEDNEGFVYKVITAGTYAGQAADVGDQFVCAKPEGEQSYSWIYIPSGDEPSGTVTSVGMTVPTGLSVSGSPITSSGTLAVSLDSGHEIPTTAHVKNYGNVKVGNTTTPADAYNDTFEIEGSGGTTASISGKKVTIASPSAGTTAEPVGTTSSGGSATTYSKSDHVHDITAATIGSALGYTPVQKVAVDNPALTASSGSATWSITNSIGSADVVCTIREKSSGAEVMCEVVYGASTITVKINTSSNIAASTYRAVIIG